MKKMAEVGAVQEEGTQAAPLSPIKRGKKRMARKEKRLIACGGGKDVLGSGRKKKEKKTGGGGGIDWKKGDNLSREVTSKFLVKSRATIDKADGKRKWPPSFLKAVRTAPLKGGDG